MADDPGSGLNERLDEITTLLDRLPPDNPAVEQAIAATAHLVSAAGINRSALGEGQLAASFERLAERVPANHALAAYALFMGRSARYVQAHLAGNAEQADATLAEMVRSGDVLPAGHPFRPFVLCGIATPYVERHSIRGDLGDLALARNFIDKALDAAEPGGGPFRPGTQLHGFLLHVRGHVDMVWNVYDPQLPRVNSAIGDLELARAEIGPEQAARTDLTTVLDTALLMRSQLTGALGPGQPLSTEARRAVSRLVETADAMRRDRLEYPVASAQAASALALQALSEADLPGLDRSIARLADACAVPALGLRERPKLLQLHGFALQTRYQLTREKRDLSNAIARLEEARRAVDQEPGSPFAGSVLLSLAFAYRTRANAALGDVDRAERIGLAGLREQAGDVLLQDSDDNALHMARRGSDDAANMARWFLARGRASAAVEAIELGRGMVLHAATSESSVAEALAAAGHPELAASWAARPGGAGLFGEPGTAASAGESGDDLRYQAMRALEGTQAEAALLSAPSPDDIAAALRRSRADHLVYLLPQEENGGGLATGLAVLVDRLGAVRWIPLPQLRTGNGSMTNGFARARTAAESRDAPVTALREWRRTLDRTCDWAWTAAVGPLLRAVSGGGEARTTENGPARVVLVALGELGLIPWHAARRPQSGSLRYACQDLVFSYASSARQLIGASRRAVRPWPQEPVLITDGDESLAGASDEVAHLYRAYYPASAVFGAVRAGLPGGGPGRSPARPADVLAALPHGSAPGASLLHFGCHGAVRMPVLDTRLRLGTDLDRCPKADACGDPRACENPGHCEIAVSVRDVLRQARTASLDPADAGGGLVVLAACLTDVTRADYDEALTLATAFLAAGSCGVVAARWAVPDAPTMLFMAAFHQFLNTGDGNPVGALRDAQLWMLDPAREAPAAWPESLRQKNRPGLAQAWSWAAFTYQGR